MCFLNADLENPLIGVYKGRRHAKKGFLIENTPSTQLQESKTAGNNCAQWYVDLIFLNTGPLEYSTNRNPSSIALWWFHFIQQNAVDAVAERIKMLNAEFSAVSAWWCLFAAVWRKPHPSRRVSPPQADARGICCEPLSCHIGPNAEQHASVSALLRIGCRQVHPAFRPQCSSDELVWTGEVFTADPNSHSDGGRTACRLVQEATSHSVWDQRCTFSVDTGRES